MRKTAIILGLLLVTMSAGAQPGHPRPEQISDEEIIQMQTSDIASWLDLDGKTKEKFVKEYSSFRKEIDAVAKNARPAKKLESEADIDKALQHNFEVSEQILQIRKKYYQRFKDFLKPSQIQMVYNFENEAGRRMSGGPGGPGPGSPDGGPDQRRPIPGGPRMPGAPNPAGAPQGGPGMPVGPNPAGAPQDGPGMSVGPNPAGSPQGGPGAFPIQGFPMQTPPQMPSQPSGDASDIK